MCRFCFGQGFCTFDCVGFVCGRDSAQQEAGHDPRLQLLGRRQVLPHRVPRDVHLLQPHVLDHLPARQRQGGRRPGAVRQRGMRTRHQRHQPSTTAPQYRRQRETAISDGLRAVRPIRSQREGERDRETERAAPYRPPADSDCSEPTAGHRAPASLRIYLTYYHGYALGG